MAQTFEELQDARNKLIVKNPGELYFFDLNKAGIVQPRSQNSEGNSDLGILRNEQAVMESVYNILLTQPGERVMNPFFGCDLNQYLFEMIDHVTAHKIMNDVYSAIERFEPRLLDFEVIITPDPDNKIQQENQ